MVQVFAPNERMLGLKFRIRIADTVSFLMLGIPSAAFEPIRERLTQGHQNADSAQTESERVEHERLYKNVQKAKVNVSALLGQTKLSLKQIMRLKEGDVLRVMRDPESLIEVVVKDKMKYRAVIGRAQSRKAVKLVEAIEPRQKANDINTLKT
jgi:flagellar motor switch protein FliM